jgi:serine phosphatase RsbU (regulator of sigma subunit)
MESKNLACMDVWGGNEATFSAFEKAGLDIWLYSRPFRSDTSGGDVYYLSSCASGRITRMLLADVSGHGQRVAGVASELRGLMRRYINAIRPNRLVEELNTGFARGPSGDRFATSVVNSYFSTTSTLSVCNAGHPPPLILRAAARQWEPLEAEHREEDMPLGILETGKYTQLDVAVNVGDLVLCYTDGVIESPGPGGHPLGIDGLQRILNAFPPERPERIVPGLVERIAADGNQGLHEDDVTILLYRITDRPVPLRDNLAAPLRWLKSLFAGA